jgi:hypothetical protein
MLEICYGELHPPLVGVVVSANGTRAKDENVQLTEIPFGTTDWTAVEASEHAGETGTATWRTRHFGSVRVRMVEYSAGYSADHWCEKGHILLCLAGELETELADGRQFLLTPGMSYQVADKAEPHRSRTRIGATLFIVD